jgi:hypothetical protein
MKSWPAGVLLILLSFLWYGRSLHYDFVWDDERAHLTRHEHFMTGNLKAIWTSKGFLYIPFSYTAWYGIKKLTEDTTGSIKPFPFRFANLLLHGLNTWLVFILLRRLVKHDLSSFLGSLLFLIHPLQVESVVWISEFRGLLASFLSFSSLVLFWKELEKNDEASRIRNSTGYLFSTLLFLLAVLSKPSVIILPVAIVCLVWFFNREKIKACLQSLVLWLIIVIPVALVTGSAPAPELKYVSVSYGLQPLICTYSYGFYLLKIIAPAGLSPCYGITPAEVMNTIWPYVAVAGLLVAVFLMFKFGNKQPVIIAGIIFLFIALLPVSGLHRFDYQRFSVVADRYVYFGMLGIALVASRLWLTAFRSTWMKYVLPVFYLFLAVQNFRQVPVWKNELSLWQAAYRSNPEQWTANYNLGVHYMKQNQPEKAVAYYSAAVAANPNEKMVLINRANSLARLKRFEESLADYAAALNLDEKDGSIFYNRALTFYNMGELSKCLEDLESARKRSFPVDDAIIRSVKNELRKRQPAE